jgi:hypothetical protein
MSVCEYTDTYLYKWKTFHSCKEWNEYMNSLPFMEGLLPFAKESAAGPCPGPS